MAHKLKPKRRKINTKKWNHLQSADMYALDGRYSFPNSYSLKEATNLRWSTVQSEATLTCNGPKNDSCRTMKGKNAQVSESGANI